ncbi:MAG: hypothetical protein ABL936_25365 [Aestuariivirga sp.]
MSGFANWGELFDAFRQMGGIADNITIKAEGHKRGIFVEDPTKPSHLHVPEEAMISVEDVEVFENNLRLKPEATVTPRARAFFDKYQLFTSWSGGGRQQVESFLNGMHSLPDPILAELRANFYVSELLEKPDIARIRERFLGTRWTSYKGKSVLCPVFELVNHGPTETHYHTTKTGVSLSGLSKGEVMSQYSIEDSWMRFRSHGFATAERWAFSDPFSVAARNGSLEIIVKKHPHESVPGQGGIIAPLVRDTVQKHLETDSQEFLEMLTYVNRLKFIKLLRTCEGFDSPIISVIKRASLLQLEALTCSWFGNWLPPEPAFVNKGALK